MSKRDSRKGDRHKPRTGDRHKPRPEHDNRPRPGRRRVSDRAGHRNRFAGLDGESVNGVYTLLAMATDDGDDDWIENPDGLSTRDCLTFLTSLPKLQCWGFAFGYDVNMMLGDLTMAQIERLYQTGQVYWREFRVAYTPGKRLQVTRYEGFGKERVAVSTTTVWDMFPWIQSSFAKWIEGWSLATDPEIARIKSMKAKRSTFTAAEHAAIKRYCLSECRYLAAGARRLVTLIGDAGIATSSYYSPATISKALMKQRDVLDYRAEPPSEVERAVEAAFVGGRSEVARTGPIEGPVYQYDICSAYPAAAVQLPCLAHGRWKHVGFGEYAEREPIEPWSLVKVSWRPKRGEPLPTWGPFPLRPRTGSLRWPRHGTTWIWGVEYLAGRRFATVEVKDHWKFRAGCTHKPFAYLAEMYDKRAALKAAGDPTEFILKLALNATYGSLAEHPHLGRGGERVEPKFRCLAWAGWITACTRARLLDVLTDDVVLLATDGILSTAPLDISESLVLGGWECGTYDEAFIAGSGIYFARRGRSWVTSRTRGFESGQLTRPKFVKLWRAQGRAGEMIVKRARFIGMGTALHRIHGFHPPAERLWRRFITEEAVKSLNVEPRREWVTDDPHDGRSVAPSLAQHKQAERQDRARLALMRTEYERRWNLFRNMEAMLGGMPRNRFYEMSTTRKHQERLLLLGAAIAHAEQHAVFFDEDDPEV